MNLNIAQQLKRGFAHHKGNWRAKADTHIRRHQEDHSILEGDSLCMTILKLGGYWEGDVVIFEDGSFLDFSDIEIKEGEEK